MDDNKKQSYENKNLEIQEKKDNNKINNDKYSLPK
jgi:hypothetical protein